jgi:hypothetical protein
MSERRSISSHPRLQELLAIPERQRTDAQWNELNELEIALVSVNLAETHEPGVRRNVPVIRGSTKTTHGGAQGKKPFKKFRKRPPLKGTWGRLQNPIS